MQKNHLLVLRAVGAYSTWSGRAATLGEIKKLCPLSRSTVYRQLLVLEKLALVQRVWLNPNLSKFRWTYLGESAYMEFWGKLL
jgi:predicted transcriptional regulator